MWPASVSHSWQPAASGVHLRCTDGRRARLLRATPLEVEAIKRKRLTIEELRRQQRRNHRPSDAYFDRLVDRFSSYVFAALDRATKPVAGLNGSAGAATNGHAAANDNAAMPVQFSL